MMMALVLAAILPGFTLAQSTTRAEYYVSADAPNLRIDTARCERFLERTERELGVQVPRFAYYRVASEGVVAQYTDIYAVGVTYRDPRQVISSQECSFHEMAHLAINEVGRPIQFWNEGMAGFLSGECDQVLSLIRHDIRKDGMTWEQAVVGFGFSYDNAKEKNAWYDASCAFSAYLIGDKRRNLDSMRHLLAMEDFKTVFGMTSAQAWHQWLSGSSNFSPSRK